MATVQSFERGLRVIRSFGEDAPSQTLAEVARATELSRATARRLLHTLVELGMARRCPEDRFALTPAVLRLGYAYLSASGLAELAGPLLRDLSTQLDESSSVAVLDEHEVVYVARVPVQRIMTVAVDVGTRFPAYRTSLGRVLLAWAPEEVVERAWERGERDGAPAGAVTTREAFEQRLAEVRELGWALVDQELELGVRSVAAPVRDGGAVVAAVNVSTQVGRTTPEQLRSEVVPALVAVADAMSTMLADTTT